MECGQIRHQYVHVRMQKRLCEIMSFLLVLIAEFEFVFEKSSYEIMEDIGLESLSVRVCFRISNFQTGRTSLTLSTLSGTAQGIIILCYLVATFQVILGALGGEDFTAFSKSLTLTIGIRRRCIAITILEDSDPEIDESFEIVVEELGISATITILDDDGTAIV